MLSTADGCHQDGSEKPCDAPFSLIHPHTCNRIAKLAYDDEMETERSDSISPSGVTVLRAHKAEVFSCAWAPSTSQIASVSGDGTGRIWDIPEKEWCGPEAELQSQNPRVLGAAEKKKEDAGDQESMNTSDSESSEAEKHLTAVEWSPSGKLLATASFEGVVSVWDNEGKLVHELKKSDQPVFAVKWSKSGDTILTANGDNSVTAWDGQSGTAKQHFTFHTDTVLDVAWRNNTQFASCSVDGAVIVGEVGEEAPLATFSAHAGEVNTISWDPSGKYLASGFENGTARVWRMQSDSPVFTLKGHKDAIYNLSWRPSGPGSANPDAPLLLATASFDCSVKLWDMESGRCVRTLSKHTEPVYSVSFSPNAQYIATGSFDRCLHVWSVTEDRPVKTFKSNGGIFQVCWNGSGDKVAAALASHTVVVMDVRE